MSCNCINCQNRGQYEAEYTPELDGVYEGDPNDREQPAIN